MTGIWRKDGEAWSLLPPLGFEDEAALHQRIAEAPARAVMTGVAPGRRRPGRIAPAPAAASGTD